MTRSADAWRGRSVFVTGHTGFKGGWLTLWLRHLGAKVHGYSLAPPTTPALFDAAHVAGALDTDVRADIGDLPTLRAAMEAARPDAIFHLAAQPLVRESYRDPLGTLMSNVMGTAHVLEAARAIDSVTAMVVITTDKVYENLESMRPYQEVDPLGGHDPYSASKAAAEIVVSSYRKSFFDAPHAAGGSRARVATARAGNVIGGGDWARDRLVPDCLRSFAAGEVAPLRNPGSIRPWQHVLEPLAGYLRLGERLLATKTALPTAWNFGPDASGDATVGDLAALLAQTWGAGARVEQASAAEAPHEAGILRLDSGRARAELGWAPRWSLRDALAHTVSWHKAWLRGDPMLEVCIDQIRAYEEAGKVS